MLDSDSGLGVEETEETERRHGRSDEDICKEYIVTWGGVCWTVPRVDDLGLSRYGCQLKFQLRNRTEKIWEKSERVKETFCAVPA